jgi:hypothetical protein
MIAWCDITEYASALSGMAKLVVSIATTAIASLSCRKVPDFAFNRCLPFKEQTPPARAHAQSPPYTKCTVHLRNLGIERTRWADKLALATPRIVTFLLFISLLHFFFTSFFVR